MLIGASVRKEGRRETASIIIAANAEPADREIIAAGIRAFNESRAGSSQACSLAVLLKDDSGQTVGGLWGRTSFGWLFVELLFVPETLSMIFKAVPFYERLGCREFGRLGDYPQEHARRFLRKNLMA